MTYFLCASSMCEHFIAILQITDLSSWDICFQTSGFILHPFGGPPLCMSAVISFAGFFVLDR